MKHPTIQLTQNEMTELELIAGKYELGSLIGSGGFSQVYKAEHVEMQRTIALKLLDLSGVVARSGAATAADLQSRFAREARLVSKLTHANTITVYDFGVDAASGRYYIAMEYIDGPDLHRTLQESDGGLEPRRAALIVRDVLRSVSEAHHLGILHRDLKPANIMLTKDFAGAESAKVLDFGIATIHGVERIGSDDPRVMTATRSGGFVGTPNYASPEQFLGEKLTPTSDIYSIGLVLWEALLGEPAVGDKTFGKCLQVHLDKSEWQIPRNKIPDGLAEILGGMLQKNPKNRYLSASEVAGDLEKWLDGRQDTFRPAPASEQIWEPAFEYGGSEHVVIDPNVEGGEIPELLRPKVPTAASSRPKSAPEPARQPQPRRAEPLELDYEKAGVRRGQNDRVVRSAGPVAPPQREKRVFPIPAAAAGAVLAVLVIGGIAYSLSPGKSQQELDLEELLATEPMHIELDGPPVEDPKVFTNQFTAAGIVRAIETAGWSVRKLADVHSLALANVHQQGYRVSRDEVELQIELITTKSHTIALQMGAETRSPLLAVVFDNKLVRVYPPARGERGASAELVSLLTRYRDLVLGDEASP